MTRHTLCTLFVGTALLCSPVLFLQGLRAQEAEKPTVTKIPGGYYVEWSSPTEIGAIQLGKGLFGKIEVMFDIPSVEFLKTIDKVEQPSAPARLAPDMVATIAEYWITRGKPERAITHYEKALADGNLEDKQETLFLNNMAMLHSLAGNHEKALNIVDQALETRKENVVLLDTKGLIYLNSGRPVEAIPPLQDAVQYSCQLPVYMMHLAQAFNQAGRVTDARHSFDPVRAQLTSSRDKMSKENQKMFDDLQLAIPPSGGF